MSSEVIRLIMCDECGVRPGLIHLTAIMDGVSKEINLCPECLAKKQDMNIDYRGILERVGKMIASYKKQKEGEGTIQPEESKKEMEAIPDITCPRCGMTYERYRKEQRLGCAECYAAFRQPLSEWMQASFGKARHEGRASGGVSGDVTQRIHLEKLKRMKEHAIASEQYERAAALRDEIRTLMAEMGASDDV